VRNWEYRPLRVETEWQWRGWVRVESGGVSESVWCLWLRKFDKPFMKLNFRDSVSRWLPRGSTMSFSNNTNQCSKGQDITRVFNTRVLGGRHMEKTQNQMWSEHGNRVFETWFISPRLSLLDSRC